MTLFDIFVRYSVFFFSLFIFNVPFIIFKFTVIYCSKHYN